MKWNFVADLYFDDKVFGSFVRNDGFRYFFEKVNDDYEYPYFMDYLKLRNLNAGSNYIYSLDNFSLDNLKVRFKNNKVIPLALATSIMLSSASCTKKKIVNDDNNNMFHVEDVQTLPNDFSFDGMELDIFDNNSNAFIVKSLNKNTLDYNKVSSPSEFVPLFSYNKFINPSEASNYLIKRNVTLNDIKDLINTKPFDDFSKKVLIEGLDNLKTKKVNINLDLLYYNIYNLSISYYEDLDLSDKSINEEARFVPEKHQIYLSKNYSSEDVYKKVLCHEILGHGSTTAYIDEYNVYCTPRIPIAIFDNEGNIVQVSYYGSALDEGYTEIIASIASGNKINCYKSGYGFLSYAFISYLTMCGLSINDFSKEGVTAIKKASDSISSNISSDLINTLDTTLSLQMSNVSFYNDYTDYIISIYMELIDGYTYQGYDDKLIENLVKSSLDRYKDYIDPVFKGNGISLIASYNEAGSQVFVDPSVVSECALYYVENRDKNYKSRKI